MEADVNNRRKLKDRRNSKRGKGEKERRKLERRISEGDQNIYDLLYGERRKKCEVEVADAVKMIHCYFDIMAKVYSFLGHDAQKCFPGLGESAAKNQLALMALQMLIRTQDKASLKAVRLVLEDEEKYMKGHEGTPMAEYFLHLSPEVKILLDRH